jgi:hypothetical protein
MMDEVLVMKVAGAKGAKTKTKKSVNLLLLSDMVLILEDVGKKGMHKYKPYVHDGPGNWTPMIILGGVELRNDMRGGGKNGFFLLSMAKHTLDGQPTVPQLFEFETSTKLSCKKWKEKIVQGATEFKQNYPTWESDLAKTAADRRKGGHGTLSHRHDTGGGGGSADDLMLGSEASTLPTRRGASFSQPRPAKSSSLPSGSSPRLTRKSGSAHGSNGGRNTGRSGRPSTSSDPGTASRNLDSSTDTVVIPMPTPDPRVPQLQKELAAAHQQLKELEGLKVRHAALEVKVGELEQDIIDHEDKILDTEQLLDAERQARALDQLELARLRGESDGGDGHPRRMSGASTTSSSSFFGGGRAPPPNEAPPPPPPGGGNAPTPAERGSLTLRAQTPELERVGSIDSIA